MFLFVDRLPRRARRRAVGRRAAARCRRRRDRRGGRAPRRDRRRARARRGRRPHRPGRDLGARSASPAEIGELFLTDHLLAFEITSIVLLVAAVGGVVLGTHARRREEEVALMDGPDVAWYLIVAAILFAIGALGVMLRRSPLIVLLSLEIMLNAANLALIAFARQHGDRRRPDLRARGDGGRRRRGRRRPRPDRRDGPPAACSLDVDQADARSAAESMIAARLDLPARAARRRARDHARRRRGSRARTRRAGSRRCRPSSRSPARSSRFFGLLGRGAGRPRAASRPPAPGSRPGDFEVGLQILLDPLSSTMMLIVSGVGGLIVWLLDRLHGRRRRGAALLRVHVALRLLDAAARRRRGTSCSCSSAGASSASRRTC